MPDVPKIVPHRLRNASVQDALAATHPEADALTAFIEQALSPPEREGVLQHLALCADCREAVVLALPALDAAVLPAAVSPAEEDAEVALARSSGAELQGREDRKQEREENKSRFGWPSFAWTPLRWATLAAGIAVAVLVVRPALERMNEKPNASINSAQNHASAPAGPPAADSQIASDVPRENPVAEGASKTLEQGPVNGLASGKDKATVNSSRSLMKPAVPPSDPEMHLAGNLARVLPPGRTAKIDWDAWERPPVFGWLARHVAEDELRRVFNLGIGFCAVVEQPEPGETVIGSIR